MNKRSQIIASIASVATIFGVALVSIFLLNGGRLIRTSAEVNSPNPALVDLYFLPQENQASVGSRARLAIELDSGEKKVSYLRFVVNYNPSELKYIALSPPLNTIANPNVVVDQSQGTLTYTLEAIAQLTSVNTLGFLEFEALRAASAEVAFSLVDPAQIASQNIPLTPRTRNATVKIP